MGKACSTHGGDEKITQHFKYKIRRELGRPRYEWEDNININLKEIRLRVWTGLALVNTVMKLWIP
jgi:hypothetical protein